MKKIFTIILILLMFVLPSCSYNGDLGQTIYVDSLGLDYDKENEEYTVYFHIASFSGLVTSELGSTSAESIYSIGKAKAKNIYEGLYSIGHNSVQNVVFNHIQSIVLTHNFITLDNLLILDNIIKTYDYITPNFYLFSTKSNLDEVYSIENPENVSSFYSLITNNDYINTYDMVYYTEFAQGINENLRMIKFIDITATKDSWQNEQEEITTLFPSGDLYINKNNEKLLINREEYKAITLLNHEYTTTIVFKGINYTVNNYKMKVKEKDGKFILMFRGNLYASDVFDSTYTKILELFESEVKSEFTKLMDYTKEKDFDILNFKDILYRKNKLKNSFDYKTVDIEYDIKFKLFN